METEARRDKRNLLGQHRSSAEGIAAVDVERDVWLSGRFRSLDGLDRAVSGRHSPIVAPAFAVRNDDFGFWILDFGLGRIATFQVAPMRAGSSRSHKSILVIAGRQIPASR